MTQPQLTLLEGGRAGRSMAYEPQRRGYVVRYEGSHTPCPGCGRKNWIVGRFSAQCAFERCGTAVAI